MKQNQLHVITDICNFIMCNIFSVVTGDVMPSYEEYTVSWRKQRSLYNMITAIVGASTRSSSWNLN